MAYKITEVNALGKKIVLKEEGQIIARARIYLLYNDLHQKPYALLEDVYVEKEFQGKGYGAKIVQIAISEAKKNDCYKIIGTSRSARKKVHQFYQKLGFEDYGKEFRMNLE